MDPFQLLPRRFGFLVCAVALLAIKPVAGHDQHDQDATVYELSDGVSPPIPTRNPHPRYPADAMRARIDGWNMVEAIVRPDGTVSDVKLVRSLDAKSGLDEESVAAARQWAFKPGTKDGHPVAVRVLIKFAFANGLKKSKSK